MNPHRISFCVRCLSGPLISDMIRLVNQPNRKM
nr:MAG TPA: hypothetical protein [Herelleviridae sp.]